MTLLSELESAARPAAEPEPTMTGPLALLFGVARPISRPTGAPVRTHRMRINPARLPDLPPASNAHPAVIRTREQRQEIVRLMAETGQAMRRSDIADATGWAEEMVGERLTELRKLGVLRMERTGRTAMWELVEDAEDDEE